MTVDNPNPPDAGAAEAQPLLDVLRQHYLDRSDAVLSVGSCTLILRGGEVHLDRDDPLAADHRAALEIAGSSNRPAGEASVRALSSSLTARLMEGTEPGEEARVGQVAPNLGALELVGPVPTVRILLDLVGRLDEAALVRRLGGVATRFESRDRTPALAQLPGLEPEMARIYGQFAGGLQVADVKRSQGRDGLLGLASLWAVGLAQRQAEVKSGAEPLVSPRALQSFLDRVEDSLESDPLDQPVEEHRSYVAALIGAMGVDHYELLDLPNDAHSDDVLTAYHALARRVHPVHAPQLGLDGREGTLRMLFERATDAYLTLSDPHRRSRYDHKAGLRREVHVASDQREQEKRLLARQHYVRGSHSLGEMDYSTAVELLKEAARMDPKPEHYSLLAQAQAKNPRWRRHAVDSFRRAVELDPENSGHRLALAQILEKEERFDEARAAYREVIEMAPDNLVAKAAYDRLRIEAKSSGPREGIRSILSRRGR